MSLGNENNNKKEYAPVVYSPVEMRNYDGSDPSKLSFSFWKSLLKISITPAVAQGDKFTFDNSNAAYLYINHYKAKMLHDEIVELMAHPDEFSNVGINGSGGSLVSLSNGKEFGVADYVLAIRKVEENGNIASTFTYQFNGKKSYSAIRNFDENSLNFDRNYYDNIELNAFLLLLEQYYISQNYALAYTVVDSLRFNNDRVYTSLESIKEKLGIPKSGKGGNSNSKSFFDGGNSYNSNNAGSKPSNMPSTTINDLENELE